jgi:hypothetical protein
MMATRYDDDLVSRLRVYLFTTDSTPENFVVTDVAGEAHDLLRYYVTSEREGRLHRIKAGYDPKCVAEEGFEEIRQKSGYGPIEFLVNEAERDRTLADGEIDEVDGVDVGEWLIAKLEPPQ